MMRLSLVPVVALTVRVDPETLTAAVRSVNMRVEGVGSGLPAESTARTSNVWGPSATGAMVLGDVHGL